MSILQQIFFREKDKTLPNSKHKKLKHITTLTKVVYLVLTVLTLVAVSGLFVNHKVLCNYFSSVSDVELINWVKIIQHLSVLVLCIVFCILFYKSISLFSKVKLSKIKIKGTEFQLKEKTNPSILNANIDEIIYFFEATKYNVVVIEDLDRFERPEIFIKLREVNLLINNSKKVKQHVVFIYAVRDEIFKDKDRTKFFDFLVPVIPVVNFSNSKEELLKIEMFSGTNEEEYVIKNKKQEFKGFINNISFLIDDMRLIINIKNEYYIYSRKQNANLDQSKLLAIIVYKNLFPDDFTKLNTNEGLLFGVIDQKEEIIQGKIDEYQKEIELIYPKIEELEAIKIKDVEELNAFYVLKLVSSIDYFDSFQIDHHKLNVFDIIKQENFKRLYNNELKINQRDRYYNNRLNTVNLPVTLDTIEKNISDSSYQDRKQLIDDWNNNKLEILKQDIEDLEHKIINVKKEKLRDLLTLGTITIGNTSENQVRLISIL